MGPAATQVKLGQPLPPPVYSEQTLKALKPPPSARLPPSAQLPCLPAADAATATSSPAQPREGARASRRRELDHGGPRSQPTVAAVTAFSSFPSVPFHFRGCSRSAGSVTTSRWLPSGGGTCVVASPGAPARLGSRAPRPGPPWPPTRSRSRRRLHRRRRRRSHSLHRRRRAPGLAPERAGRAARVRAPGTRSSLP